MSLLYTTFIEIATFLADILDNFRDDHPLSMPVPKVHIKTITNNTD